MTPHMQTLGWTLLHFFWQASVIAALYKLVDLGLSHSTSHVRYLLSLTALLAMFAAATATLFYEEHRIQSEPATTLVMDDTFVAPYLHLNSTDTTTGTAATSAAPASLKSRLQRKVAAILPLRPFSLKFLTLSGSLVSSPSPSAPSVAGGSSSACATPPSSLSPRSSPLASPASPGVSASNAQ